MLYQTRRMHHHALNILRQFGIARLKHLAKNKQIIEKLFNINQNSDSNINLPNPDHSLLQLDMNSIQWISLNQLGHPKQMMDYYIELDLADLDLLISYGYWILACYPIKWLRIIDHWEHKVFHQLNSLFKNKFIEDDANNLGK